MQRGEAKAPNELIGGRYRVQSLLGQGGMGAVHAVLDEDSGQRLALKRLHVEGLSDTRVSLFEREYRTLASLQHPRIVRVYDYGIDAQGAYYTMELLEGDDLASAAPLPWREVCLCLRDAASILGVLHARRLVHRDLSPRNLWRTPDGRLKLLDFGALAPFGKASEVVGTPPLTAPEVLRKGELDARTDLFALGALGYWLLTTTHAFPARQMSALEGLWEREPTVPSRLVQLISSADHSVPVALDELITNLLRIDPEERPRSTVDVVDSLNAIAELESEAGDAFQKGYLDSVAFVGRKRERRRFESSLARARNGKSGALSFEGPEGIGRSRLLSELGLSARLAGVTVISLDASQGSRSYGLAEALGRGLITALPDASRKAAEPFAARLASCSFQLARQLGTKPESTGGRTAAQIRSDRLKALYSWVRAVCAAHTVVVLVDDLHRVDEPSQALLAMLAHERQGHLLLAASASSEHVPEGLTAHGSYRQAARCLSLAPLAEAETRELLHSAFGDVPNLPRTAARLQELSGGRPGGILTLTRHLVETEAVRYREGAWVLPAELPEEGLPTTAQASALRLVERLSPQASALAVDLSVVDYAPLSLQLCRDLPGIDGQTLQAALGELLECDLLLESDEGLELAHASVREHLRERLSEERRGQVHRAFATSLQQEEGDTSVLHDARVGMHWYRAGEAAEAQRWMLTALRKSLSGTADMRRSVNAFEDWLKLLEAKGASDVERAPALVAVSVAGYLVERSYAERYGDETRQVFERLLGLRLARTLRPVFGGKLSLGVALLVAGILLQWRKSPVPLKELLHWFMTVMCSIAGGSSAVVDAPSVRKIAHALEPFGALGMDHVAGVASLFTFGLLTAVEDRPAKSLHDMQTVIDRLRSDRPLEGLEGDTRQLFLAGAAYCNGVRVNLANRTEGVFETADEIERVGPVQALTAEYLRSAQYAVLGKLEEAQRARQRLEMLAIQVGSGWQAECLAPAGDMQVAFWTWDPVAMKRAAQELSLLAKRRPSMAFYENEARALYALMRGRYEKARDILQQNTVEPLMVVGWARQRAALAAAHIGLGEHQRALEICRDVIERVSPADLDYVQLFLAVQIQEVRALFALGETERALSLLDGYLEQFADRGPLVVAYLHRIRADLSLQLGDLERCEQHVEAMAELVVPLRVPSLRAAVSALRRGLLEKREPEGDAPMNELFSDDAHLMTRVQLVLTHAGERDNERAGAGLRLALQLTGAASGFLLDPGAHEPYVSEGEQLETEVLLWAQEQLTASAQDSDTMTGDDDGEEGDSSVLRLGDQAHSLSLLWHPGVPEPVAALVLSFEGSDISIPPDGLRRALAGHLWETRSGVKTGD